MPMASETDLVDARKRTVRKGSSFTRSSSWSCSNDTESYTNDENDLKKHYSKSQIIHDDINI